MLTTTLFSYINKAIALLNDTRCECNTIKRQIRNVNKITKLIVQNANNNQDTNTSVAIYIQAIDLFENDKYIAVDTQYGISPLYLLKSCEISLQTNNIDTLQDWRQVLDDRYLQANTIRLQLHDMLDTIIQRLYTQLTIRYTEVN